MERFDALCLGSSISAALWVYQQSSTGGVVAWWSKSTPSWWLSADSLWELWDAHRWEPLYTQLQSQPIWNSHFQAGTVLPVEKDTPTGKSLWPTSSPWLTVWDQFPQKVVIQTLNLKTLRETLNPQWLVKLVQLKALPEGWQIQTSHSEYAVKHLALDWVTLMGQDQWQSQLPLASQFWGQVKRLPSYHLFIAQVRTSQLVPQKLVLTFLDKIVSPVGTFPIELESGLHVRIFFLAPEAYTLEHHEVGQWMNRCRQIVRRYWGITVHHWDRVEVLPYAWVKVNPNQWPQSEIPQGEILTSPLSPSWPTPHWLESWIVPD